jgi:hypothetical protein
MRVKMINMTMAALLMSGAMHSGEPAKMDSGEPAKKLTLGTDTASQANGGAPFVLAAAKKKGR